MLLQETAISTHPAGQQANLS